MPLPQVEGWLIDFETAKAAFESGSNMRINHLTDLCTSNELRICHLETKFFKAHEKLVGPFINDQDCACVPDGDVTNRCVQVASNPQCANIFNGNETPIFLTATAASRGYGVISDHRSIMFTTTFNLCQTFGIPVLSADEYFAALQ